MAKEANHALQMGLFYTQCTEQGVVPPTPVHQGSTIAVSAFYQGNDRIEPTTLQRIDEPENACTLAPRPLAGLLHFAITGIAY